MSCGISLPSCHIKISIVVIIIVMCFCIYYMMVGGLFIIICVHPAALTVTAHSLFHCLVLHCLFQQCHQHRAPYFRLITTPPIHYDMMTAQSCSPIRSNNLDPTTIPPAISTSAGLAELHNDAAWLLLIWEAASTSSRSLRIFSSSFSSCPMSRFSTSSSKTCTREGKGWAGVIRGPRVICHA